jgi:hypothetical protein
MVKGMGSLTINALLMGLSVATLTYTIVYSNKELSKRKKKDAEKELKGIKQKLRVGTLCVKGVSFGVTLYGMYTASNNVSPISIILTTLLLIVWIISVLAELLSWAFEMEWKYFEKGLEYDLLLGEERDALARVFAKSKNQEKDKIVQKLEEMVQEEREETLQKVKTGIDKAVDGIKSIFTKGA